MSIIQKPVFSNMLKPMVKISFLVEDIRGLYQATVLSVAKSLRCQFIMENGHVICDDKTHQTITMIIPSAYIKSDNDFTNLKNFLKLICKRQNIICFLEFGSIQQVYDFRSNND